MIEVVELTRRYGAFTAVDNVSFKVEPGLVTGFLGPNGAGKSTTMRAMVGLTPPSSGHTTILGVPYKQLNNPGRQVGVLLDASAQHSGRTRPGGAQARRDGDGPARSRGSTRCSSSSGSPRRRPSAGSATTRSVCGSGSASRTRCWATRRC